MSSEEYKLLDTISSPRELKKLPPEELSAYCDELRRYIIDECAVNPGHLASSLGAVELAAALHYVFDTPEDRIVWDVGHQTYAHKIITGRREAFKTKRQLNGISGFPRMSESEYDSFGGGHASVSISAAFGMAKAAELRGEKRQVVAVIGDGSMTGGLAFEGLNNAGASGLEAHQPAGDSQRQQHGHRPGHGSAEKLPAENLDFGALQPFQTTAVGADVAYAAAAAALPEGGQRREAGAAEQEQFFRKSQFSLFRSGGRSQPQGVGADASGVARHRGA